VESFYGGLSGWITWSVAEEQYFTERLKKMKTIVEEEENYERLMKIEKCI